MPPKNPLLRQLPNILTASRLGFTLAYLALLWVLDHNALDAEVLEKSQVRILDWAFVLFVIAGKRRISSSPSNVRPALEKKMRPPACSDMGVPAALHGLIEEVDLV